MGLIVDRRFDDVQRSGVMITDAVLTRIDGRGPTVSARLMIDSGATRSLVSEDLLRSIGIEPVGYRPLHHARGLSESDAPVFEVLVTVPGFDQGGLPVRWSFGLRKVSGVPQPPVADGFLGRDFLRFVEMHYNGPADAAILSTPITSPNPDEDLRAIERRMAVARTPEHVAQWLRALSRLGRWAPVEGSEDEVDEAFARALTGDADAAAWLVLVGALAVTDAPYWGAPDLRTASDPDPIDYVWKSLWIEQDSMSAADEITAAGTRAVKDALRRAADAAIALDYPAAVEAARAAELELEKGERDYEQDSARDDSGPIGNPRRVLYHGTSTGLLERILAGGLNAPCLTSDDGVALYFAQEAAEADGTQPVVLEVDVDEGRLRPDRAAFEEPLTFWRDKHASSDEEWFELLDEGQVVAWPADEFDWQTSLDVTTCVRHAGRVGPESIRQQTAPNPSSPDAWKTPPPCDVEATGRPLTKAISRELKDQPVRVHLNLHNGCYVFTHGGLVTAYARFFYLRDVLPRVGVGGYERCHTKKVRNVHAYLEGTFVDGEPPSKRGKGWRQITYNCKTNTRPCFYYVDNEECFEGAAEVRAWRVDNGDGTERCEVWVRGPAPERKKNPPECECRLPGGACGCGAVDEECARVVACGDGEPTRRLNPASDDGRYVYVHSCPESTSEDIRDLRASERQISRQTFARKLAPGQWSWIQSHLGYDRHLPISQADWQIPYYKGTYRGVPAVFLEWSGFEFIFTLGGRLGPSAARPRRNPSGSAGAVLANTPDGLAVLLIDPASLREIAADGTFWAGTCPAGLGYAVTSGGRVTRHVAREGWLKALLHGAASAIAGEFGAIRTELAAGEEAVEAAATELGVSAEEVVGALVEDAEAWGAWATGAAVL